MLVKFKASFEEVTGSVAEVFPYFEFYANVMGTEVIGITKILKISTVNPAEYLIVNIDSVLLDRVKSLWPKRLEDKAYVELSASVV